MSVRGNFGYLNIIPNSGPYAVFVNFRTQSSTTPKRLLLYNNRTDTSPGTQYIETRTNGTSELTLKLVDPLGDVSGSIGTFRGRFDYLIYDYDPGTGECRFHTDNDSYSSLFGDFQLDWPSYFWLYNGPATDTDSAGIPCEIFYIGVLQRLLTSEEVKCLVNGVQPLEIFTLAKDMIFFREYPLKTTASYFTAIGDQFFQGASSTNNLALDTYYRSDFSNQYYFDKATEIVCSNSVRIVDSHFNAANGTINIRDSVQFSQTLVKTNEYSYTFGTSITIGSTFAYGGDKNIVISSSFSLSELSTLGSERVLDCGNQFQFELDNKAWDGKISTSFTITTAILSSTYLKMISSSLSFDQAVGHNIKDASLSHLLFLSAICATQDVEEYEVSTPPLHNLEVLSHFEVSKILTRPLSGNDIHLKSEFDVILESPAQEFGV